MQGMTYGKNGFHHDQQLQMKVLDIGSIDMMVESLLREGLAKQEGDIISIDMTLLGIDKVLGSGKVQKKLHVAARAFSEQAKAKIEGAGGQTVTV